MLNTRFRLGFADARANLGFNEKYDSWNTREQYFYEIGRLFAVSRCSKKWRNLPTQHSEVTPEMIGCYVASQRDDSERLY